MTTQGRVARFLLLVAAMSLITIALGWWGIALAAFLFPLADRSRSVAAECAIAAGTAWLLLFAGNALVGDRAMIGLIARATSLPSFVLPFVTVVFPSLLAWSAATAGVILAHFSGRRRREDLPATSQA